MKLDKYSCLGGRINNKDVIGMKYNGHVIYSLFVPEDPYKNYYTIAYEQLKDSTIYWEYSVFGFGPVSKKNCVYDRNLETNWGDGITTDEANHQYFANYYIKNYYYDHYEDNVWNSALQYQDYYYGSGTMNISSTGFIWHEYCFCNPDNYQSYPEILENFNGDHRKNCISNAVISVDYIRPDIIDGSYLFCGFSSVTSDKLYLPKTSHMTNMRGMFKNCESLTTLDLSHFDTSNVTNMSEMFYGCTNLTTLNLSNWDLSNVTGTYDMFYGCNNLTNVKLNNCSNSTASEINAALANR